MPTSRKDRLKVLFPRLLMVLISGYAIAAFATVEAPDSAKIRSIETTVMDHQQEIDRIKKHIELED